MPVTSDLPRFVVNAVTGAPLLRLLLAIRGEEPPSLDPEVAWDVFKQFARVPADNQRDVISFQATFTPEDSAEPLDPPILYVTWSRELTAEASYGLISRAVQLQWCFDPIAGSVSEVEIWSDSFPDLDAFFAEIESLPAFSALMASPSAVELYAADVDDEAAL